MTCTTETHHSDSRGGRLRLVVFSAFLICAGIWFFLSGAGFADHGWFDGLLLLLAVAATVAGLSFELPLQNAIMAAVWIAGLSGLFEAIGARTGIPFGPFSYTERLGASIFGILPWPVPLLWAVIVLNSRQAARLILRHWPDLHGRGLWTVGLASLLAVALDLNLEPFAAEVRYFWIWRTSATERVCHGVPWLNSLAWAAVTALLLVATVPWLVNKRPYGSSPVRLQPLWLWLTIDTLLGASNAAHGLWDSAAVGLFIAGVVAALTLRRART